MNAQDVLKYGHQTVLRAIDGFPQEAWETGSVVGVWSAKDVVAHLASFERVLVEILGWVLDPAQPTPTLELFVSHEKFNEEQVALRKDKTPTEVLAEYEHWHAQAMALAGRIPPEAYRKPGILPWYGAEYDLEDFLIYTYYGHKREHAAQVALFKKRYTQKSDPVARRG